ncbi:DUF3107 domain-containing protein [Gryllotalpicola sp.]|uniref:DUF3107 domain-containing protein n=1 Tax=Gryllotalpicola sp. TaxID=1932787 RepID=UPI00260E16F6|nr:DUF3107 domain-containing protein [Gryllotalpicola sp.]
MEIRIGIVNAPRELSFESSSGDLAKAIKAAIAAGDPVIEASDDKGATYLVPTAGIAYVQFGTEETRRVGFVG